MLMSSVPFAAPSRLVAGGSKKTSRQQRSCCCVLPVKASRVGFTTSPDGDGPRSKLNQLDAIRACGTKIVVDSGDVELLKANQELWRPVDATTNPSLILKAASQSGEYYMRKAEEAISSVPYFRSEKTSGGRISGADGAADGNAQHFSHALRLAGEAYAVGLGADILSIVPGRVSTETDARLSFDTNGLVEQVRPRCERLAQFSAAHGAVVSAAA